MNDLKDLSISQATHSESLKAKDFVGINIINEKTDMVMAQVAIRRTRKDNVRNRKYKSGIAVTRTHRYFNNLMGIARTFKEIVLDISSCA